jgi:hypothetical protein
LTRRAAPVRAASVRAAQARRNDMGLLVHRAPEPTAHDAGKAVSQHNHVRFEAVNLRPRIRSW